MLLSSDRLSRRLQHKRSSGRLTTVSRRTCNCNCEMSEKDSNDNLAVIGQSNLNCGMSAIGNKGIPATVR